MPINYDTEYPKLQKRCAELQAKIDELENLLTVTGIKKAQEDYNNLQAKVEDLQAKVAEQTAMIESLREACEYWKSVDKVQATITELQAKVDELTNINNLLLIEHSLGGKISRHTSYKTWGNWVDACREVEEALKQEGTGIQDMMAEVEALSQEGE